MKSGAVLILFTSLCVAMAQAAYVPDLIAHKNLKELALSSLEHSLQDQVTETNHPYYLPGEFRTRIQSTLIPAIVGVGKGFTEEDEATAFTTATVVNMLAQFYLENTDLAKEKQIAKIPEAIAKAVATFERYKNGETYNFYPPYVNEKGEWTRRPKDMTLFPIWYGFTHIPNDADTTSSVVAALLFHQQINGVSANISPVVLQDFSKYTDVNRNPMFYNRFEKRSHTGAFMTWLQNEKDPNMPTFMFAAPEEGPRIPFVKNDVDCIVNVNVLKMLAMLKTEISGQKASCAMINDMIKKDESKSCGVYYPNTYNLAFSLASGKKLGLSCLTENSEQTLLKKLLSEQNADGSWHNIGNVWIDETISTLFAMSALMELGEMKDARVRTALFYGTHYLIKKAQLKNNIVSWPADNYFTATAIARSLIMWRSKAFTNLIAASVLMKMHKAYPQYKARNYEKLSFK